MRKQFNLQDWLKDKSQKVETRDGRPVKIISFEMTDTNDCPIAAQFRLCAGTPVVYLFDKEGHYKGDGDSDYDLFIITPEEELTEFEQEVSDIVEYCKENGEHVAKGYAKRHAKTLLSFAEKELSAKYKVSSDMNGFAYGKGYEEGKKEAEENLTEQISELIKDFETYIKNNKGLLSVAFDEGYEEGKADALKDLPRWKKIGQGNNYSSETKFCINGRYFEMNDTLNYLYEIALKDLEKLPKGDEK